MRVVCRTIDWTVEAQSLPEDLIHYCVNVHRAQSGLHVVISDGGGKEATFELVESEGTWTVRRLTDVLETENIAPITVFYGLPKGDKLDRVVRQLSELGIARLVLLKMSRNVVTLDEKRSAKRLERLRRVATEAARQSERTTILDIDGIYSFEAGLELARDYDHSFFCHPAASGHMPSVSRMLRCALFVGPEGGLTEHECSLMTNMGIQAIRLGPTILRTETAAVTAAAVALCRLNLL